MKTPFWLYIVSIVAPAILVAIGIAQTEVSLDVLFRDPLVVAQDAGSECCHIYFGFYSSLGILLWCSTVSVCLFASMLLAKKKADPQEILFMVSAGLFTGLLLFDDLFLGHELIYPKVIGVDEKYVIAAYAVFVIIHLSYFRNLIIRNGYSLLLIGLFFFSISIFEDFFQGDVGDLRRIAEDGSKFLGISTWTAFHFRAAWLMCTGNQHDV